jgi:protoheme IX farnesyltransferase
MSSATTTVAVAGPRQVVRDYVALTKPKVQSLLLLTTVTTMYLAGDPSIGLVLITLIGGYLSPRRRRDQPLVRPRHRSADARVRPTAPCPAAGSRRTPRWPSASCWARCRSPSCGSGANPLAAALSFSGFLGYTLVLHDVAEAHDAAEHRHRRRRGRRAAAGRLAATTGTLNGTAVYLFAIVFFWTPPHFWALSLLMKDEYARVGVPMLPVVRGEHETRRQILLYSVLLYA